VIEALVVFLVVLAVVAVVGAPLRTRGRDVDPDASLRAELADLDAAKEAKYREIRDAELDQRTGKLSEEDHRVLDAELRSEAIALLKRIDAVKGRLGGNTAPVPPPPAVG
jgi:flagellar biosynthesis/type III secretory pathway M-ring protein FliF/YscJ